MYFIAIVVTLVLSWGFWFHKSQKYMRDCVRNLPGPYGLPLLGAVITAFSLSPKNVLQKIFEYRQKYGNIMRVWFVGRLLVPTADYELNEQLLSSIIHIKKHRSYSILHQWLGVALLLSSGNKWHWRRKIITPTFHFKILEQFVEVFDQQSTILVDCLAKKADGQTIFNVYPYICAATLDIIAETAMGTRVNAQTDTSMQYTSDVNDFHDTMFFIVVVALLFALGYWLHASQKYMRDCVRNLPGPYCPPLMGAVVEALAVSPQNVLRKTMEYTLKYGSFMKIWVAGRLIIATSDYELNEQLFSSNSHITKHRNYTILHQWLGVGLLLSTGNKWHSRRKIITPTFHFRILEQFLEVFDQQSTILVDCLAKKADGQTVFNVYRYICAATLDIIAETAMGTKVNAQTDDCMQYTSAVNEMTALMAWRFMRPHLNNELIFMLCYPLKKLRQMKLIRSMQQFTRRVIEERRTTLEKTMRSDTSSPQDQYDVGIKKRMALLDVLLQATIDGQPLTNEDIREEVDTFMFEGHDTTASALSFTLHLLARHPLVQNKILAEIQRVYGVDQSVSFTLMNLNELKYMECAIKEALRLYPSVPIVGREIEEDFKYKNSTRGDGILPAGTEVLIFIYAMLRDPARFKDPSDYIPERHEDIDTNGPFAFVPFSAGPRNCIGQKFAMYEMKVVLTKILMHYELLPLGENVEPVMNIVMRSENGMQLGLRKRERER